MGTFSVGPSGYDYSTLAAWETARQGESDALETAQCYGGANLGTFSIAGGGWNGREVVVEAAEQHEGVWDTDAAYIEATSGTAISIDVSNVTIRGLQIGFTGGTGDRRGISTTSLNGGTNYFEDLLISGGDPTSGYIFGIYVYSVASAVFVVRNNLIYRMGNGSSVGTGIRIYYSSTPASTNYWYNNTIVHCDSYGFLVSGNTVIARNNVAQSCANGFHGSFDGDSDYNVSDLSGDAPGTHAQNSATVTFADPDADDWRLDPDDTVALDGGENLSEVPQGFSVDALGITRPQGSAWDCGPFELEAGGYLLEGLSAAITVAGSEALLTLGRLISAQSAAVEAAGTPANLLRGFLLAAGGGTVAVAGTEAGLRRSFRLQTEAMAVEVAGPSATLRLSRILTAGSGTVVVVGTDALLTWEPGGVSYLLECLPGAVAVEGQSVGLLLARRLEGVPGAVTVLGQEAALRLSRVLLADPASVEVQGTQGLLRLARTLEGLPAGVIVFGTSARLVWGAVLSELRYPLTVLWLSAARNLDPQAPDRTILWDSSLKTLDWS